MPFDPASVRAAAERIVARIRPLRSDHAYTYDLALQLVLRLDEAIGEPAHRQLVADEIAYRGWTATTRVPWRKEPFGSLSWEWARANSGQERFAAFAAEAEDMRRTLPRTHDGIVTHPRGDKRGGGDAVLLDSFAEYASRIARGASVTGDATLRADVAKQVRLHRDLLRDPASGLWRQGRGWPSAERPEELSPGTWSRGQGWLVRGLVAAIEVLPPGSERDTVRDVLIEEFTALAQAQQPSGLWHALPHRPPHESGPETSGSGLIAGAFLDAVRLGIVPADPWRERGLRAVAALLPHVDADGVVHQACQGPGPLSDETPWRALSFAPGDPHGPGTVLAAFTAALHLER